MSHAFLTSPLHATYPANLILFDLITSLVKRTSYKAHYAVFSNPLLGPNILLSTPFSNTFNACFSFNVRD